MSPLFAGILAAATGYEQSHILVCRRRRADMGAAGRSQSRRSDVVGSALTRRAAFRRIDAVNG